MSSLFYFNVNLKLFEVTLNLSGKDRVNFVRTDKPISVAIEQCGIVGVINTKIVLFKIIISSMFNTFNCSKLSFY